MTVIKPDDADAVSLSFAGVTYWRAGLVNLRLGIPITITAVAAAPLGALLAPHAPKTVLLALFAAFLILAGAMMLFYRHPTTRRTQTRRVEVATGGGVGALAGFLGGLLGVGGGNIILPTLAELGLDAKTAAGTTGLAVVFSSLSGFAARVSVGHLDLVLLAVSVVMAAAGSKEDSSMIDVKDYYDAALLLHGHKCPAMPLGLRAGAAAMDALGVPRSLDGQLLAQVELGEDHCATCFADGVQMITGCTFGKGNITRLGYGKFGLILADVATGRHVRVVPRPCRPVSARSSSCATGARACPPPRSRRRSPSLSSPV